MINQLSDTELNDYIKQQHKSAGELLNKPVITENDNYWIDVYLNRAKMALDELRNRRKAKQEE